jgi:predicted small lipoprotein YifL
MPNPKSQIPNPKPQRERKGRIKSCVGIWVLGFGLWDFTVRTFIVALIITATVACGKKGPPLLPFIRQAKAAEITSARRAGNDVYLTIAVPAANIDDSTPASVAQIQVLAVTAATPPPQSQFTTIAMLVTTIQVARYADPSDKSGKVVPDPKSGALQGESITIKESLTPETLVRRELPSSAKATEGKPAKEVRPAATPPDPAPEPEVLRRFYMTIPLSDRGRPGVPSTVVEVPMTSIPDKVEGLELKRTGHDVVLLWEPAGGLLGWLLDRALPVEPAPLQDRSAAAAPASKAPAAPSGPVLYPKPVDPLRASPAVPINKEPLSKLTFTHDVEFDGRKRCYYVRAVRGTGAQRVEGEPSDPKCDTPFDNEAPAAPTGLTASAEEGSISLRWEPNGEEDLGGYLVLRRDPASDTLRQLTPAPIAETTYTDSSVTSGQMYTYIVRAVDKQTPKPNVSEGSMEVMVTAR